MSTGLEFHNIEWEPNQWYWIRQSGSCPKQCWDWREEDPDVVGPFPSREALLESYSAHEANTGGTTVLEYTPDLHKDKVLPKLIADAVRPDQRYGSSLSFNSARRPYRW